MNNPIRFAGLDLHTDEQSAPNSALALCAGVECEGGTLKPSFLAYTDLRFEPVVNSLKKSVPPVLVYLHESSSYKHFICRYDDDVCVMYGFFHSVNDTYVWESIPTISNQKSDKVNITSIGNTLVFNINGNVHYVLFKRDEENYEYKYLGQKPPFVELQFGTSDRIVHNDLDGDLYEDGMVPEGSSDTNALRSQIMFRHATSVPKISEILEKGKYSNYFSKDIKEEQRSDVTEAVKAFVNKANHVIAESGGFYAPFLVRYAYRLYDDSQTLMMHSSPVLMPVSMAAQGIGQYAVAILNASNGSTEAVGEIFGDDNLYTTIYKTDGTTKDIDYNGGLCLLYYPANVKLTYRNLTPQAWSALRNDWSDIVKGIDVFITAPIANWDQSQLIKQMIPVEYSFTRMYFTGTLVNGTYSRERTIVPNIRSSRDINPAEVFFKLPEYQDRDFEEMLTSSSAFFLLHSFSIEDDSLATDFTKVPYRDSILPSITTQRQMVDDYKSHNIISANSIFTYNHRLHLADVKEVLFKGFRPDIQYPYAKTSTSEPDIINAYVLLTTEDGVKSVKLEKDNSWNRIPYHIPVYLFYPDTRAVGISLEFKNSTGDNVVYYNLPLKECSGLNGAAWYGVISAISEENKIKYSAPLADTVHMPNKLYISPIDNPFSFEPSDIMTVGTGRILGMAVSTRAISQGQYGTFPLTVFCSDGIWTFSVNAEGKYLQPSYLSSAITNNPAMLTQLDQSVIFPTKQAVNMLYGGDIRQISAPVNGLTFNTSGYPKLIEYLVKASTDYDPARDFLHPWHIMMYQDGHNPVEDITSSRCIYDAVNERLIFTKMVAEQYDQRVLTMAYVYSLATDSWSTLPMPQVTNVVNAAPHPYLTLADGTTACLDQRMDADSSSTNRYGVIVTRALKFEGVHKCIQAFDHSHSMKKPPVMFVFGSNNLRQWHYVCRTNQQRSAYMPGATWRYFRMCLLLDMTAAERFYVTHLDIVEKYRKL